METATDRLPGGEQDVGVLVTRRGLKKTIPHFRTGYGATRALYSESRYYDFLF